MSSTFGGRLETADPVGLLGCGRATLSYGKPGHALHLTYLTYNHATYGGLVLAGEFCHRGIKGRDTGSPKRANCLHLAAA